MEHRTLDDRKLYKTFLSLVKYLPLTLALVQITGIVLNYFGIAFPLLTCIGGSSILFILLLWIISYVFKFCYLYRLPLMYNTIVGIIIILDFFIGLPVSTIMLFRLHIFIIGSFVIAYIYYAYKNRNKPQIDYIRDLCKRYCNCN